MMKLYILKENNRFNKHFIILNPMGIKFKQHTHNDLYIFIRINFIMKQ